MYYYAIVDVNYIVTDVVEEVEPVDETNWLQIDSYNMDLVGLWYDVNTQTYSHVGNKYLIPLKVVDGAGSGLDADTVDGKQASEFALASHTHDYAPSTHTHTDYAPVAHTHDGYANVQFVTELPTDVDTSDTLYVLIPDPATIEGNVWESVSLYKGIAGTYVPPAYYSIIYDKSQASDPSACLTYASMNADYTPMSGGNGNANEGSWAEGNGTLFDSIEVGYFNGTTWTPVSKSSVAGSTSYNCFTKIPKIYQKATALDSNRVQLDLGLSPFEGASLHPAFIVDDVEKDAIYIGRYLGYVNSSKLESKSGKTPSASATRANFRTYAQANGAGYNQMSYYDWDLVNKLYLMAFKNFNSQSALGWGYAEGSSVTGTGGTNSYSWMYGTTSTTGRVSFLGLEDWWGNLYQWVDNYMTDSSNVYAGQSSSPSDSTSGMSVLCANPAYPISGVYPLTCRGGLNDFFIGESRGGTVNSTGLCDYQYFFSGSYMAIVGGDYNDGNTAGAFFFNSVMSTSDSDSHTGARLTYKP